MRSNIREYVPRCGTYPLTLPRRRRSIREFHSNPARSGYADSGVRFPPCVLSCRAAGLCAGNPGNISGTVQDSTGVIPGAVVKVTNVDTGVSQTLVTNVNGFYNAPLLNPGNYQVSVEMAGYKALDPQRRHAVGRPAAVHQHAARGRIDYRAGDGARRGAAASTRTPWRRGRTSIGTSWRRCRCSRIRRRCSCGMRPA